LKVRTDWKEAGDLIRPDPRRTLFQHSVKLSIDRMGGVWTWQILPMRLSRRAQPFDSEDFIFELKIDGWRALAFIESGECKLVSRNGNTLRGFRVLSTAIAKRLKVPAVLDGEICCLDEQGFPRFYDLMFKRNQNGCYFYAFDGLMIDGEDLRGLPLLERKERLKRIIPRKPSYLLYVDHIENRGCDLFEHACRLDLEGVVAKRKTSIYHATQKPSPHWIKIKNPSYSQAEGHV
jgi:bifunctional non-homologous end joining protein LigD